MDERVEITHAVERLMADVADLGPVRAVLRSCSGFAEFFCAASDMSMSTGWLSIRQPTAHLHLQLPVLRGALLLEAGEHAHPHAPSVWLYGRCGSPCLLLILDQAEGAERARQEAVFRSLRTRYGTRLAFESAVSAGDTLH